MANSDATLFLLAATVRGAERGPLTRQGRTSGHHPGCRGGSPDMAVCQRTPGSSRDLAGPGYHINRSDLLVLESKTDMQKRGQASPDDGDALALTFARPVAPAEVEEEDEEEEFGPIGRYGSGSSEWMR